MKVQHFGGCVCQLSSFLLLVETVEEEAIWRTRSLGLSNLIWLIFTNLSLLGIVRNSVVSAHGSEEQEKRGIV